jgi:arsenate reductase
VTDETYNVLFLCTGNPARSIVAESALGRWGRGRFKAFSAGNHPKGAVRPMALRLLCNLHHETDGPRSKSWDELARPGSVPLDFVIAVRDDAAGEVCPPWPGQPTTAHRGVEDPANFMGRDDRACALFKRLYSYLEARIKIFTSLPIQGLDSLSLQRRLDAIGRAAPEAGAA